MARQTQTTGFSWDALPKMPSSKRGKTAKTNDCACGCGGKTGGRFVPGHDSKLKSAALKVLRGVVAVTEIPAGPFRRAAEQEIARLKREGEADLRGKGKGSKTPEPEVEETDDATEQHEATA